MNVPVDILLGHLRNMQRKGFFFAVKIDQEKYVQAAHGSIYNIMKEAEEAKDQ